MHDNKTNTNAKISQKKMEGGCQHGLPMEEHVSAAAKTLSKSSIYMMVKCEQSCASVHAQREGPPKKERDDVRVSHKSNEKRMTQNRTLIPPSAYKFKKQLEKNDK